MKNKPNKNLTDRDKKIDLYVFFGIIGIFALLIFGTFTLINKELYDFMVYGYWYIMWIAIGTWLGIVIHEFGHVICCHLVKVKVIMVKYLNNDNSEDAPEGFVVHEVPTNLFQSFMITIGPIITVGLFIIVPTSMSLWLWVSNIDIGTSWMFIGCGMVYGLFPSRHDVSNFIEEVKNRGKRLQIILSPVYSILYLISYDWFKNMTIFVFIILGMFIGGFTMA